MRISRREMGVFDVLISCSSFESNSKLSSHHGEIWLLYIPDFIDLAPYLRLRTARDPMLWDYPSVLKDEITPDQTPTHFFQNRGFGTGGGGKRYDLTLFRRPLRFAA